MEVETVEKFVEYVQNEFDDQQEHLFRGQSQQKRLLPSIARGISRYTNLLDAEREMLEQFKRRSVPHLHAGVIPPSTLWDWMALAQHHGLPTRLLDWSLSPVIALWFVVRRPPTGQEPGVVWAIREADDERATEADFDSWPGKRHLVFAPREVSTRMTTQSARFTVHKSRVRKPHFEPLEESEQFRSKLVKIVIPASSFAHIRYQLDRIGLHAALAFPGLDGLCEQITWKWFKYVDEMTSEEKRDFDPPVGISTLVTAAPGT